VRDPLGTLCAFIRQREQAMLIDDRLKLMARLMDVSALKAQVHAGNIANQNTPGYRAKAVAFDQAFEQALRDQGADEANDVEAEIYEPQNTPVQDDGNDVSLNQEIMESAKNQTMYNAYLAMVKGKMRLLNIAAGQAPGG
jgi:flagellar basal-body rod protein FlgB